MTVQTLEMTSSSQFMPSQPSIKCNSHRYSGTWALSDFTAFCCRCSCEISSRQVLETSAESFGKPKLGFIPPEDQANAAAAQQAGKSKDLFVSNGIPLFYCWSHGLSKTSQHTSKTCNNQSEGHCADATIENRLGGVNKINFGRSGKQRRVPTA
jgi:hypothetical protein